MAALQLASVGQQGMVDRTSGDAETFPLLQSTDGDSRNGFADDIQISVHGEQEERNLSRKLVVSVTGMTCAACSTSVETALKRLPGVETAAVALIQEKAEISYNPALLKEEDIVEAIEDAGFDAEIISNTVIPRPGAAAPAIAKIVGQFRIGGMTCAACVTSIETVLRRLPGVSRASVALTTEMGEVEFDPRLIDQQAIISTIDDAGFDAELVDSGQRDKISFVVMGMDTDKDSKNVEAVLCDLKGVREFSVDCMTEKVHASIDSEVIGLRAVVDAVESRGSGRYKVVLPNPYTSFSSDRGADVGQMYQLFLWSCVFSIPVVFIGLICPHIVFFHELLVLRCGPFLLSDWLKWALVTPVQFIIGWRFYVGAYRSLRRGSANMDVLVTLGTTAAYLYSVCALLYGAVTGFHAMTYFETSAMLFSFVLLGKYLESLAKGKTSEAIGKLLELAPTTAILLTVDSAGNAMTEREINVQLIQRGDLLKVQPGAKVPADGTSVWGVSHVNESMITGEASPVAKEIGDSVIGGTINMNGVMHIRALRVGRETALAQIVNLVETAQMTKAPIQKFADYVASIFVPVVVSMAVATFLGWYVAGKLGLYPDTWLPTGTSHFVFALMFAISVTVIACPCALGLATPTAVMVATGIGASNGILIKGGDALERAHKVGCVVFDKTGTLTKGKPAVTHHRIYNKIPLADFLTLVASAEVSYGFFTSWQ
ncbi:hypothetical protein BDL97_12G043100 [Sphagnum fallax]|nr:hypothetical protein BDL97_12G043100 [Sphagnum fallax]